MKVFSTILFTFSLSALPGLAVDYKTDVLPIMKERCWDCHANETKVKGNLALDDLEEVRDYQIGKYNIIRPGNSAESNFVERLLLDSGDTDFMPRKAEALPKKEIETIQKWIDAGAIIDRENMTEDEAERVKEMSGGPSEPSAGEFLTWMNREGKEIEARFLSVADGKVKLLLKNGKQYDVPISSLSGASVEQAKKLAGK
ncbi:MAG: hypothetical protein MI807_05750 [Verrucomicrobiales bacterium]|nr:hypothetical protein [Verrucomicrobiales bacterium]